MNRIIQFLTAIVVIVAPLSGVSQTISHPKYSTDGVVNSIISTDDKLILGGQFSSVGIHTGGAATFPLGSDQVDVTFPKVLGEVYSCTSDGNNGFYIYGDFYKESENPAEKHKRLEHLLADNSFENNFSFTVISWSGIQQLQFHQGVLYGCGKNLEIGGTPTQGLFGINTTTQNLVTWIPTIDSTEGVYAFGITDNTIYFSGSITAVGGIARTNNAAIEINSGLVTPWQPAINNSFKTIGFYQDKAVIGGNFSLTGVGHALATVDLINGTTVTYLFTNSTLYWAASVLKLCVEGNMVYTYSSGTYDTRVTAIALTSGAIIWEKYFNMIATADCMLVTNGSLVIGGHFFEQTYTTNQDNAVANFESSVTNLFSLNTQTGNLTSWQPNVVGSSRTTDCLALANNKLFAGGTFSHANGFLRTNLCVLNLAADQVLPYQINFEGGEIKTLKAAGTTIYIGGNINQLDGVIVNRPIMAFNLETPSALPWQPNLNGNALAIEIYEDTLYLGGDLFEIGGSGRQHLFAINLQTGSLQDWAPNPNYFVKTIHISNDKLFVGGDFTNITSQPRNHLASFNRLSLQITEWNPNVTAAVNAIASKDNTIWIGGDFWSVNSTSVRLLAGIDSQTGALIDIPTNAPTGSIKTIVAQGKWIIAGGRINFGANNPCTDIVLYDTLTHTLATNSEFCVNVEPYINTGIRTMTVTGNDLYFAGKFLKVNGSAKAMNISHLVFPNGFFEGNTNAISYYPLSGGNGGSVTINFFGSGIVSGMQIKFTRSEVEDIEVSEELITFSEPSSMTAVVDLNAATIGQYNIVITDPSGNEILFENGFTVEAFVEPVITAQIIAPSLIRTGTATRFIIQVQNAGNCDAYGVPVFIFVSGDNEVIFEGEIKDFEGNSLNNILEANMGENYRGNEGFTKAYLPMIPKINSGATEMLIISITANDSNGNHTVEAIASGSALSSNLNDYNYRNSSETDPLSCYGSLLSAVFNEIIPDPLAVYQCGIGLVKIYDSWSSFSNNPTLDVLLDISGTILDCATAATVFYPPAYIGYVAINVLSAINSGIQVANDCGAFNPNSTNGVKHNSESLSSFDPNDKFGTGVKDAHYITGRLIVPYCVRFENIATAGLPAQQVRIEDTIDPTKYDLSTFSLDYITIAGRDLVGNPARGLSRSFIDMRPEKNVIVKIEMTLNTTTGEFVVDLSALDADTLQPLTNPLEGFLNPNLTAPEGEGSICFSIMPKQELISGTIISNTASIFFDSNTPIITPTWFNTIDKIAPVSSMNQLPQVTNVLKFPLSWNGTDSESGIEKYDIYYSENNSEYTLLKSNYYGTSMEFAAKLNSLYSFYSVATDAVGHREIKVPTAETTIQIISDDIIVYPNPVTSSMFIQLSPNLQPEEINLIDMQGRKISTSFTISNPEIVVSIPNKLNYGLYIVEVKTATVDLHKKVIINNQQ